MTKLNYYRSKIELSVGVETAYLFDNNLRSQQVEEINRTNNIECKSFSKYVTQKPKLKQSDDTKTKYFNFSTPNYKEMLYIFTDYSYKTI